MVDFIFAFCLIWIVIDVMLWLSDHAAAASGLMLALVGLGVTTWGLLALTGKPSDMNDPTAVGGAAVAALLLLAVASLPIIKAYEFLTRRSKKGALPNRQAEITRSPSPRNEI